MAKKLRCRRQIVIGVAGLSMPEIGRKPLHPGLNVLAVAIPAEQGAHRKGVAFMRNSA